MRFDVPANQRMLATIIVPRGFEPEPDWQITETSSLEDVLSQTIGPIGMQPVDAAALELFDIPKTPLRVEIKTDLGTVMDMGLVGYTRPDERLWVCEVGGGYGRLAEAFLQLRDTHYVLVDAVPVMLMYAYEYLRREFPDRKIGAFYAGDAYGPEWDCYVLPAWKTDMLASSAFDLTVNIESMQEMSAGQVAHYIGLFDRLLKPMGTCYISNARDYKYKGDWPFPVTWEVLYQHNTPRSWTPDHPTFLFRKDTEDFSANRQAHEEAFRGEVAEWDKRPHLR